MLSKFNNEVLVYGPTAVLPQNLDAQWLTVLQAQADDFLDTNYQLAECKTPRDNAHPVLSSCVITLLDYLSVNSKDLKPEAYVEKLTLYALALTIESIEREQGVMFEKPTVDNILTWERVHKLHSVYPELVQLLKDACMLTKPKKNWFQSLKQRLSTGDTATDQPNN